MLMLLNTVSLHTPMMIIHGIASICGVWVYVLEYQPDSMTSYLGRI